jgi:hypothetical protein
MMRITAPYQGIKDGFLLPEFDSDQPTILELERIAG